jgi:hypothetical protein
MALDNRASRAVLRVQPWLTMRFSHSNRTDGVLTCLESLVVAPEPTEPPSMHRFRTGRL